MFKTIFVPLDGSALAEQALEVARPLALLDGAEVTLLRVPEATQVFIPAESGYSVLYPDISAGQARAEAKEYLAETRATLGQVIKTQAHLGSGEVAAAIVDDAKLARADLIVMASDGYSGFTRWMLGSVAEKVLHAAPCPVLVIRQKPPGQRILIPLDGSRLAEQVLPAAMLVAMALHLPVTLLRVLPPLAPEELANMDEAERGLGARLQEEIRAEAEDYLHQTMKGYATATAINVALEGGNPARAILHYAETHGCDLIAMATHGRTGLRRWLYGSVTEKVLRGYHGSMLVTRPTWEHLNA
jgi:nucleotide-binding universal stress UspA family protein